MAGRPLRRARALTNSNGYVSVIGLHGFVVVDRAGKLAGFGENEDEVLREVRNYDNEYNAFQKPYSVWRTEDLIAKASK